MQIQLTQTWTLGQSLGKGGFAEVFLATDPQGKEGVIKLVPKSQDTSRELLFEELSGLPNIMPIWETGETSTHFVLLMPRADKSLREYLVDHGGKLTSDNAIAVLKDIATALEAIKNKEVVHRDLKPENVLLFGGKWCLADFGIARYATASTDPQTQKFALTPIYAAPEQWRHERATSATDIYALGIMAFELLNGEWPFKGPQRHELMQQHLHQNAPALNQGSGALQSLVADCLSKAPGSRPTPTTVLNRLARAAQPVSGSAAQLQQASAALAQQQAAEATQASVERSAQEQRRTLYNDAGVKLERIANGLKQRVLADAPNVQIAGNPFLSLRLGAGTLAIGGLQHATDHRFKDSSANLKFDVVATSSIRLTQDKRDYDYEGREHALWFCDAQTKGEYRWFELAFMMSPLIGHTTVIRPFSMKPDDKDAVIALSPIMHTIQAAWPFTPIDQGEEEDFYERWLGWLALAARNGLRMPTVMPEQRPEGSWRR